MERENPNVRSNAVFIIPDFEVNKYGFNTSKMGERGQETLGGIAQKTGQLSHLRNFGKQRRRGCHWHRLKEMSRLGVTISHVVPNSITKPKYTNSTTPTKANQARCADLISINCQTTRSTFTQAAIAKVSAKTNPAVLPEAIRPEDAVSSTSRAKAKTLCFEESFISSSIEPGKAAAR